MTTLIKVVVVLLLVCLAVIAIAPTGYIESHFQFAEWFRADHSKWGFRLSVIALSVAVIALVVTMYFAWIDKGTNARIEEIHDELREQRHAIENIDSNLGRLMFICADNRSALSNLEGRIKELSAAVRADRNVK